MIDVEIFGADLAPGGPSGEEIRGLCTRAAASRGVHGAHVAIEFVDAARSARLNAEHRGRAGPTDVLSFPIDGAEAAAGVRSPDLARGCAHGADAAPRELGDIVICPPLTRDLREAIVHGMLHLLGMDHERDDGEMLALQRELLAGERP